jgi:hypothetical protein
LKSKMTLPRMSSLLVTQDEGDLEARLRRLANDVEELEEAIHKASAKKE